MASNYTTYPILFELYNKINYNTKCVAVVKTQKGKVFTFCGGPCYKMNTTRQISAFAAEWLEILLKEYEEEVKEETRWMTILLTSESGRRLSWSISSILGVNVKGVPGNACRLLERYLSRHVQIFLQETRSNEEWERYIDMIATQFYLLTVSCVLLAAKMSDLQAPLNACRVKDCLEKADIYHSTAEIVDMESHVFSVLDYRLPLWTTLEITEFLAAQVGLTEARVIKALGVIIDLTECYRDTLELYIRIWIRHNKTIRGVDPGRQCVHKLFMCAGAVSATALLLHLPAAVHLVPRLARMLRADPFYIKALAHVILHHIIPEVAHTPIVKKRRLL